MAILSKSAIYGIRATLYIALSEEQNDHPHTSIRKISDDLDISFHFLTKILQTLTQQGIIGSARGPKGGVHLARPTKEVSLLDIITAIEGKPVTCASKILEGYRAPYTATVISRLAAAGAVF